MKIMAPPINLLEETWIFPAVLLGIPSRIKQTSHQSHQKLALFLITKQADLTNYFLGKISKILLEILLRKYY